MKTFLKILLIALAVVVAIKLLPVTLLAGCVLAGMALLVLAIGVSAAAGLFCVAVIMAAALSPVWLPVLAVIGLIRLCRRPKAVAA